MPVAVVMPGSAPDPENVGGQDYWFDVDGWLFEIEFQAFNRLSLFDEAVEAQFAMLQSRLENWFKARGKEESGGPKWQKVLDSLLLLKESGAVTNLYGLEGGFKPHPWEAKG